MANPYYIPRPKRESRVFQLANAAIGLGNLKNDFERTNIMKEQGNRSISLLERRADQELGERGTIQQGLDLQSRQVGVSERAATLAEQKFDFDKQKAEIEQQKVKRLQTPLSAGDLAVIEAQLPRLDNVLGFGLSKAAKSYVNRIKAMSEGGATRLDLYYDSKQNWPHLKQPLLEEAKKGMESAVKDGDQEKVQTIKSTIDAIESGEFLRMIFPQATTYDEQLQATREQELKKTILAHPGTDKGPKPADYSRAIADIFKKYSVGGLINVLPDGTIDMQSLLAGKQSAYQIIQQKADQGDREANKDLDLIQGYYGEIEKTLLPNRAGNADMTPPAGQVQYEATATNPQTGEKLGLINGQWIPIR